MNKGKQFENVIRTAFEAVPDTAVIRLPDPVQGYLGYRNICDFIVYHYPTEYFIECKSISSDRFPFANITDNQWKGMLQMSKLKGVRAGIICWFINRDVTLFIDIRRLQELRESNCKGIRYDAHMYNSLVYKLEGKKKRIFFDYDMEQFFKAVN